MERDGVDLEEEDENIIVFYVSYKIKEGEMSLSSHGVALHSRGTSGGSTCRTCSWIHGLNFTS
jgi:hypothetical protein